MKYNKLMHDEYLSIKNNLEKRAIRFMETMEGFEVEPEVLANQRLKSNTEKLASEYLKNHDIKTKPSKFSLDNAKANSPKKAVTFILAGNHLIGVHNITMATPKYIGFADAPSTFSLTFSDDGKIEYTKTFKDNIDNFKTYTSLLNLKDPVYSLRMYKEDGTFLTLVRSNKTITTAIDNTIVSLKPSLEKYISTKGEIPKFSFELHGKTDKDDNIKFMQIKMIIKNKSYLITINNQDITIAYVADRKYIDITRNSSELKKLYDELMASLERYDKKYQNDNSIFIIRRIVSKVFDILKGKNDDLNSNLINLPTITEIQKEVCENAQLIKETIPSSEMQRLISDINILFKRKPAKIIRIPRDENWT